MAILEITKEITIPEKSDTIKEQITVQQISPEIPIKISPLKDVKVFVSHHSGFIIQGLAEKIEMEFTTTKDSNIIIPDLKETIRGTLTVEEGTPVIELRDIPIDEAIIRISEYIREHDGCRTSDIIIDLALDPDLVIAVLHHLSSEKLLEGGYIESE